MMTTCEAAQVLGISEVRVRQLAASGALKAMRHGRAWVFEEEDVMARAMSSVGPGRPCKGHKAQEASCQYDAQLDVSRFHNLYVECKDLIDGLPPSELIKAASSQEEASFYVAVFDFFLQQKQTELIEQGVY